MSLYPSLEDLNTGEEARAQIQAVAHQAQENTTGAIAAAPGLAVVPSSYGGSSLYAGLGLEEFTSYMGGLDLRPAALAQQAPELALATRALVTGPQDLGQARAQVKDGVRKVVLCKGGDGKLGLAVKSVDKGIFVAFVWNASPAALGGVRFGDQILQINGKDVAGWKTGQAMKALKKADGRRVEIVVRDRPFERTVTCVKDSMGGVGFAFKKGKITGIVKDSSAARNGLLINHALCEVNGQNVVGMKDDAILGVIRAQPRAVTVTIMPTFVFDHIIKSINFKSLRANMDHSVPEI